MVRSALAIFLLCAAPAFAQPASPPACSTATVKTTFDVATIKPSTRPAGSSHFGGTPDTLNAGGTVRRIVAAAYGLHDFQITGGPDWLGTDTWEVVAKLDQPVSGWADLPSRIRSAIQAQRLQALLAQRFALRCHFETKDMPVYNLVLAKGGSKLQPTPADGKKGSFDWSGTRLGTHMTGTGVELANLVGALTQSLGRTVIDKTGLSGRFDFTLTYSPDPDPGSSVSAATAADATTSPTIFTALQEQLGLRLEPAKGPVPVLIIDSIQKPSEN